jgi:transcriptional regulator with XRE-family HTH domain
MRQRQRIFLREWRKHRGYSLEQMAERLHMNKGALSRVERGERPYSQDFLEAAAEVLMTDPASLLMRDPSDPEGIWSLWDRVADADKDRLKQIVETFAGQPKTGTNNK